jgi:hypothetical protein
VDVRGATKGCGAGSQDKTGNLGKTIVFGISEKNYQRYVFKYIKSKVPEGNEVFSGLVILPSLRISGSGGKDG